MASVSLLNPFKLTHRATTTASVQSNSFFSCLVHRTNSTCETGEGQTERALFKSDFMTLIIPGEKITGVRHLHYKMASSFMFSLQLAHFPYLLVMQQCFASKCQTFYLRYFKPLFCVSVKLDELKPSNRFHGSVILTHPVAFNTGGATPPPFTPVTSPDTTPRRWLQTEIKEFPECLYWFLEWNTALRRFASADSVSSHCISQPCLRDSSERGQKFLSN